jgi:anaerobic selenocysteine-containing dehydrogenase
MVSVDLYVNETTKHAHYILPTSFGLERNHYDLALYALAVRNAARWAPAALPAPPGVRSDWDVLTDLVLRLYAEGGGRRDRKQAWLLRAARALGPERILDLLLRLGPYGRLRGGKMSLAHLRAHPHGVDLGPLEPRLRELIATNDRRIHLAPPLYLGDLARLDASLSRSLPDGALALIGRRHVRSNNSWMHNAERLVKGRDRCTLLMHPRDAETRGLSSGDRAEVTSRTGRVVAPVEVSADIAPGVVSLPHGWGHTRPDTRLAVAQRHAGVSINDLTDESCVDALSGTAALAGVEVRVARVEAVEHRANQPVVESA